MAAALPVTKLAGLLMKTLAKPLSKRIKHDFSRYKFTQNMLIGIGQTNHTITSRMTIWSAGYRVRSITPLEESKAMAQGAEFVGESFVLLVSGTIIVWEYSRGREKERMKQKKIREEAQAQREALQAKLHTLDSRLKALEAVVQSNTQSILGFGGKRYEAPTDTVPIDDDERPLPVTPDLEAATMDGGSAPSPSVSTREEDQGISSMIQDEKGWKWLVWRPW